MQTLLYFCLTLLTLTAPTHTAQAASEDPAVEVIMVLNDGKMGDQSHVRGIASAIQSRYPTIQIHTVKNTQLEELEKVLDKAENHTGKTILLTSGGDGIPVVLAVTDKKRSSNILIVHTSHMLYANHLALLGKAHLIGVPSHAVNKDFLEAANKAQTPVVQTIGVPHDVTLEKIKAEYEQYAGSFAWLKNSDNAERGVAMINLGGDAPLPSGKMQFCTIDDATQAADLIGPICKEKSFSLMIFNGSRTGQHIYNSETKKMEKDETAHQSDQWDPVTTAFVGRLKEKDLNPAHFRVYNFRQGYPSLYKAAFWVLKQSPRKLCVSPGESTSVISEANVISEVNDTWPEDILILTNHAMNDIHFAHVKAEVAAKRARAFDLESGKEIEADPSLLAQSSKGPVLPAAVQVAEAALKI